MLGVHSFLVILPALIITVKSIMIFAINKPIRRSVMDKFFCIKNSQIVPVEE